MSKLVYQIENAQGFGRPVEVYETHINAIINSDRHNTTREIAENRIRAFKKIKTAWLYQETRNMDLWKFI